MAAIALGLIPEIPSIITGVGGVVHAVESLFGKGNGSAKKAAAQQMINSAVSSYNAVAQGTSKLPSLDDQNIADAVSEMIDACVKMYNALGVFKRSPAPTPAPTPAPAQ